MTEKKRYCPRGHDTFVVGRKSNHRCCECERFSQLQVNKDRRKEQKRREAPGVYRFLAEPLRERVRAKALQHVDVGGHTGTSHLARLYAERYGLTEDQATTAMHTLLYKRYKTVEEDVADRWCVLLGVHPVELWPEEWPLAEAVSE